MVMTTRFRIAALLGAVAMLPARSGAADPGALTPAALRCECRVDPLGLDVKEPRLNWEVCSPRRGQRQTAYRFLVAGSPDLLRQDRGDLWDSGRVESDETTGVVYRGRPLSAHQVCHWKLMVWDKDGQPSAWSQPAMWSLGPLAPSDWTAQWIGSDRPRPDGLVDAPLDGAKWVWFAGEKPARPPAVGGQPKEPVKGPRVFLANVTLPELSAVEKVELLIAADEKYVFTMNGENIIAHDPATEAKGRAQRVNVTHNARAGANSLRGVVEHTAGGPVGLLAKLIVRTRDGKTTAHVTDASWRCTDQPGANWHNREIKPDEWPACQVLGDYTVEPGGKRKLAELVLPPPAYLRTTFRAARPVKRATVYATALGVYDLHLNGRRVSDDFFNPGWIDYTKRVYYRAYDVTERIQQGDNVLGAILADGWYSGHIGWKRVRDHYGKRPRLQAELRIEYQDGGVETVATGPDWKVTTDGPIREADFLMGEVNDARKALDGWDRPGFDDRGWDKAAVGSEVQPVVQAHPGPPVRAFAELRPVAVTEPLPGVYVLDMGQNFAGAGRLTVHGETGQKVQLRFAERLNPDGTIYTANLRDARATDTYVCRGGGSETWQPRFTFHGFQYVEVTGLKTRPGPETVVGVALSSDTPVAGSFECSDPMLNKLHSNVYWTQRANFIDIPTDCPQRDERLGWTGDAQVYARTATLNADVQAFFTKWLVDLADGQRADGQFPMVAPVKVAGDDGGPAWADAGVICPWTVYEVYGDRRLLERQYPSMKKFIAFCKNRCTPELLPPEKFHCFGDWLSIDADTPKDLIFTAYFAQSTRLTAQAAAALGKTGEAVEYRRLYRQIRAAFNRAYVAEDGRIKGDTQTAYVLALAFDLLYTDQAAKAAQYLVADIEKRGGHLSTGFIGTKDLMLVLAKIGRNDVAYRLIHNDTFPSWGFSIKHGATSIWERWDGWTPAKGFQTPGMNSFAHYSFGAVYQWMVETIGGIRTDGPAYKRVVIAPQPGGRVTWAKTSYHSVRGSVATSWKQDNGRFTLEVSIPANTAATVFIPAARAEDVTEGGRPLAQAEGVKLLRTEGGWAVLAVESGVYRFAVGK
jgi:alpha-L-rhamnosidase